MVLINKHSIFVYLASFIVVLFCPIIGILVLNVGAIEVNKDNNIRSEKIGGPCEYKDYKGIALIVSIQKAKQSFRINDSGGSVDLFEVMFHFYSNEKIEKSFVNYECMSFMLLKPDNSLPDCDFLKKYSIAPGKKLECIIKIITKGSCNPIIFHFPGFKIDCSKE